MDVSRASRACNASSSTRQAVWCLSPADLSCWFHIERSASYYACTDFCATCEEVVIRFVLVATPVIQVNGMVLNMIF
jgi:hypothetical protein